MIKDLWSALRPPQWVKNLVVFAAVIFARRYHDLDKLVLAGVAFVCFCLISSAVYLINDLFDRSGDRNHPAKKDRPIASGRVSTTAALVTAFVLGLVGLSVSVVVLEPLFLAVIGGYILLNLAYSTALKHVVILDVMTIAGGFVLRAVGGGLAVDVPISSWLLLCTTLLALFLGFGKRRHELVLLGDRADEHRGILTEYSPYFLDQMIGVVTASTVVAYSFYTLSTEVQEKLGTHKLFLTVPFVLYGVFRYLYLIHQRRVGGNPTRVLLTDRPLLLTVLLWLTCVLVIMSWHA